MTITLYGWGAMFDMPSPSPFVLKTDIQMQMLGLTFDRAVADLESVNKHKAPYVRDGDVLIQDSTFIRWHFEKQLGLDLDARLTPQQRGVSWAVERMLERHLATIMGCERWLVDANFDKGPRQFFGGVPEVAREGVIQQARADLKQAMYGGGMARFSREEQMQLARADVAAVAAILGEAPYLFGDQPSAVDATAYGVLASCATRFFDSELVAIVASQPTLVAYLERMRQRYFATDRWPKMG